MTAITLSDKRVLIEVPAIRFNLVIDLLAPRKQIIRELDKALRRYVPYRPIDPLIYKAVALVEQEGMSYEDASRRVFQTPRRASTIRNWRNKLLGEIR